MKATWKWKKNCISLKKRHVTQTYQFSVFLRFVLYKIDSTWDKSENKVGNLEKADFNCYSIFKAFLGD